MPQTTVFNHWVPRSYLRRWSSDGRRVWAYQLLVPHGNVPLWKLRSIEYTAGADHLYTTVKTGDSDEFEKWLKAEIEDPALEPLTNIVEGRTLSRNEWDHVTRYVLALDRRTPASYLEDARRWEKELPGMMNRIMADVPRQLKAAAKAKKAGRPSPIDLAPPHTDAVVPVRSWREDADEPGMAKLRAEIVVGRELWLYSMRHVLSETIQKIGHVRWSVMHPHSGSEWFTSDHPVLRLNFNSIDDYNFGGGWVNRGSEVIVPISPTHLLYRQVGHDHPATIVASPEQTVQLQRFIAERAHREIYATRESQRPVMFRPRAVNADQFKHEQSEWATWHERQSAAELEERPANSEKRDGAGA
jgi:hypothetical protein